MFSLSFIMSAQNKFNGLDMNIGNLFRLSDAKTRSISPENVTGEKGKGGMADPAVKDKSNTANASSAARDLGQGWKVNPYIVIKPGETFKMAEIDGPGMMKPNHPLNVPWATFSGWVGINILRWFHQLYV